jgi:hypothetical protein
MMIYLPIRVSTVFTYERKKKVKGTGSGEIPNE